MPDNPSLCLHRPAATDANLQPPGQDGFYVLAPVPNMRAGIDWERAAPLMRDRVVAMLAEDAARDRIHQPAAWLPSGLGAQSLGAESLAAESLGAHARRGGPHGGRTDAMGRA